LLAIALGAVLIARRAAACIRRAIRMNLQRSFARISLKRAVISPDIERDALSS
jgi:hypothetical protein